MLLLIENLDAGVAHVEHVQPLPRRIPSHAVPQHPRALSPRRRRQREHGEHCDDERADDHGSLLTREISNVQWCQE
jgi:hypothetical protein